MSVKGLGWSVVIALALSAEFAGATVSKPHKPAARMAVNWSRQTSITPAGAYVLGKPAARVRLVEYISYTCSHCADYVREAALPLKTGYVARGQAVIELRHAVRDSFDLAATLLARCGGPARFFGNTEAIMAAQATWLAKAGAYDGSKAPSSIDDGLRAIARLTGLDQLMVARGYTPAQIDACLTNDAQQKAVTAMTSASFAKISGTPSFELNGTVLDGVHSWAALEPQLQAAVAR